MAAQRPNILLIVADQQRYDCIGYSGGYPVKTPNIDRLAAEGMWFSRAYSHIPLCCPARQSLLNGRRPEAFGALWNYDLGPRIPALQPTEYSWPRELADLGYSTGYVGKWHVSSDHDPTDFGFDDFVGTKHYEAFRKQRHPDPEYANGWFGERDPVPVEDSQTHWLADQAIKLADEYSRRGRPWHLRLDFPEPHLPCRPAGVFAEMYDPEDVPIWGSFEEDFDNKPYIQRQQLLNWGIEDYGWSDWAPIVARYYGIISQMDDAIGRVLEGLDRLLTSDTIVIYTSDHGDLSGGHRMMDKHYVLYEDVVKVPLIIKWPEMIESGRSSEDFVYNFLDLPPTIAEILGNEPEESFHGRSLMPLLSGTRVSDWRTEVVSTYNGQQFGLYTQRMIRNYKWKYVWNTTDVDELYDLEEDPNELVNLIHNSNHAIALSELRKRLYFRLVAEEDGLVTNEWMRNQLLNGRKL